LAAPPISLRGIRQRLRVMGVGHRHHRARRRRVHCARGDKSPIAALTWVEGQIQMHAPAHPFELSRTTSDAARGHARDAAPDRSDNGELGRAVMEPLLSARELAEILGVNLNYVYEQAAAGRLPSYKIGGNRRFRASEVEAWLDLCRQPRGKASVNGAGGGR
jgi:excisionase family DNA binding protein